MESGGGDITQTKPPEGSCGFFLPKKRRFCKFRPNNDHKYCAEHACVMGVQLERKRIPCPLDPKHTCYEDCLEKHLKKCNKREKETNECYREKGINSGTDEGDTAPDPKVTVSSVSVEELQELIHKVNKLYDEHIGEIQSSVLSHNCLREELENPTFGTPALRHRKQQASLIGHLEKLNVLKDGVCYVELGAGKGQLSHWVQKALHKCDNTAFILVDKGTSRYKLDNQHREDTGPRFERLRIDLEDLNLGKYPSISANEERPVVGMGKHLCGAATDLALRCMLETMTRDSSCTSGGESPRKKQKTECNTRLPCGVVIALCCHHRCTWRAYTGKSFMRGAGLTSRDFQLLASMSSWATCTWKGWRKTGIKETQLSEEKQQDIQEADEHDLDTGDITHTSALKLSESEREEVGRRCKRLIDHGRVEYLRTHDMDSHLREYIDHHLTPENIALIAQPRRDAN